MFSYNYIKVCCQPLVKYLYSAYKCLKSNQLKCNLSMDQFWFVFWYLFLYFWWFSFCLRYRAWEPEDGLRWRERPSIRNVLRWGAITNRRLSEEPNSPTDLHGGDTSAHANTGKIMAKMADTAIFYSSTSLLSCSILHLLLLFPRALMGALFRGVWGGGLG